MSCEEFLTFSDKSSSSDLSKAVGSTVIGSHDNEEHLSKAICAGNLPADLLTLQYPFQ